jgi:hypothetical protein
MGFPFRPKYRNKKVQTEDGTFDSKREHARWLVLKQSVAQGLISDLQRQVTFKLEVNGQLICRYRTDFTYRNAEGALVVEDAKGFKTPEYKLKKKLMAACLGIDIVEV